MSALGQKQTFYAAVRESALPPKADISAAVQNVRLVPIADIMLQCGNVGFSGYEGNGDKAYYRHDYGEWLIR